MGVSRKGVQSRSGARMQLEARSKKNKIDAVLIKQSVPSRPVRGIIIIFRNSPKS